MSDRYGGLSIDARRIIREHRGALQDLRDALGFYRRDSSTVRRWIDVTEELEALTTPSRSVSRSSEPSTVDEVSERRKLAAVVREMARDQERRAAFSAATILRMVAHELEAAERVLSLVERGSS